MPDDGGRLPLTVFAAHLPRHPEARDPERRYDRALCPHCYGTGTTAHEREVRACGRGQQASGTCCEEGQVYCARHRCRACQGTGVVCPSCRGMRASTERDLAGPGDTMTRCPVCTEGNNVNPAKEMRAIQGWLRRHCADCGAIRSRAQMTQATRPDGAFAPCPACGSLVTLLDVMVRERDAREQHRARTW